jgi:hypothetical protein
MVFVVVRLRKLFFLALVLVLRLVFWILRISGNFAYRGLGIALRLLGPLLRLFGIIRLVPCSLLLCIGWI